MKKRCKSSGRVEWRIKACHQGKLEEWKPSDATTTMPENFETWVKDNVKKIAKMKNPPFFIRDNYQQGDVDKGLDTRITAAIEQAKLAAATAKAKTEEPKKAEPKPAPFHRATLEELKAAGIKVQFEGEYKNSFAENSGFDFVEFKQQMENVAETLDLRIDEFLINPYEKKFEFAVRLKNKDGKTAIRLSRNFYKTGNNKIECYHAGFTIDPSLQGKGISKQVFAKLYTEYQRMGVDVLTVDANLDVGGYTWTKYGFNANRNAALAMAKGNKKMTAVVEQYIAEHPTQMDFPMKLLAEVEGGKEWLLGKSWKGTLDLHNPEQVAIWEEYLGLRKKGTKYDSTMTSDKTKLTPTPIQDITHIKSALANFAKQHPEHFTKGFKGINAVSEREAFMSISLDGEITINFATNARGYNAGESIVRAIDKLNNGEALTRDEEYAVESLWHEILHNKSKNTTILPDINEPDKGFTRAVAETINQLVARHTYGENLLTELGGKPKHQQWVLEKGYSYDATLDNLRLLLQKAGINESEFVERANKILMQDYTDIDKKIVKLLTEMNKNKKLDVARAFGFIEIKPKFNS